MRYQGISTGPTGWRMHWGIAMSIDTSGGHPAMDYKQHTETYSVFVRGTVILVVGVVLLLAGMAIFLV